MSDAALGPVVRHLGGSAKPNGHAVYMATLVISFAVSAVVLAVAAFYGILFFVSTSFPQGLSLLLAVLLGFLAFVLGVVAALGLRQYRRLYVTVQENGMEIGQMWFQTERVPWNDVQLLSPPQPGENPAKFFVVLRSGQRILVRRLCFEARTDHDVRVLHHPDVQFVLDQYIGWRARHGMR